MVDSISEEQFHRKWGYFFFRKSLLPDRNDDIITRKCTDIFDILRPGQNGRHSAQDIFKFIFFCENCVLFWLKFHSDLFSNMQLTTKQHLVQIMAWCRIGNKWTSGIFYCIHASLGLDELTRWVWVLAECIIELGHHWFKQWVLISAKLSPEPIFLKLL